MSKNIKRNLIVSILILLVLYLAKMEAINFIVAVWAGVWVMVKLWAWATALEHMAEETIFESFHSLPTFIAGALLYMTSWQIFPALAFLPGIATSYLTYSLLNLLFIPAK